MDKLDKLIGQARSLTSEWQRLDFSRLTTEELKELISEDIVPGRFEELIEKIGGVAE